MILEIEKDRAVIKYGKGLKVLQVSGLSTTYLERQKKNYLYMMYQKDMNEAVKWAILKLITQINEILQNRKNKEACGMSSNLERVYSV